ncbi:HIT family protein [Fastidiosibacter lacustris]|uniref:HIT family protein n=1 Tax=Fastidiosibacter lacustris TaxID=2056695 RepID=UPI000E350111|nr:HIT family protein [Fastidiosibacter lacustris]
MKGFKLDDNLATSSSLVVDLGDIELRLSNNALLPWLLLIPKVNVIEWYELDENMQRRLNQLINVLSKFLKEVLNVDKVNVAIIGNVVSQMHVHVIGRNKDDFCWPNVVWGKSEFKAYTEAKKRQLCLALQKEIDAFCC